MPRGQKILSVSLTIIPGLPDFFSVQHTKTGKIFQITTKYTKWQQNISNSSEIRQMDIFHCKTFQNLPKFVFLFCKYTIWQHCIILSLETILRKILENHFVPMVFDSVLLRGTPEFKQFLTTNMHIDKLVNSLVMNC
jgi:hypothetical protein